MKNSDNFSIVKTTKSKLPSFKNKPLGLFFEDIKNGVLGKEYELSLVFIGNKKSKSLNRRYRNKDKSSDILSFPLSKSAGEIFICHDMVKRNARKFDMDEKNFVSYLFIHGLLHLKGFKHSKKMEEEEEKFLKSLKFKI